LHAVQEFYGRHGKKMAQKSEMMTEKSKVLLEYGGGSRTGWQQPLLVDRGLDWRMLKVEGNA